MQTLCNRPAVAGQEAVCASDPARLCVGKLFAEQSDPCCFEQPATCRQRFLPASADILASEAWSVRMISDRFGLSAPMAVLVMSLAGIGPQEGAR